MLECMIASVPLVHIRAARKTLKDKGKVQFGSRDVEFFQARRTGGDLGRLEVFIFPAGAEPVSDIPAGTVALHGILEDVSTEEAPELRPATAYEGDTPSPIYWTIRGAELPDQPIGIGRFVTRTDKPHSTTPRRAMLARIDL